jgi:hypothetical protein
MRGVAIRSRDVRINMTDMRTMTMTPGLSMAPEMYRRVPYQKARPKVPKTPKN